MRAGGLMRGALGIAALLLVACASEEPDLRARLPDSPPYAVERLPARYRAPSSRAATLPTPPGPPPLFPGEKLLASQSVGGRRVWVFTSHRLDPTGPSGPPGYWVALSDDGRVRRLYTGLTRGRPFELLANPAVALLEDGHLQLEARRTAPSPQAPARLLLRFELSLLERDSDGDGLTDLEELRLMTDPHRADTDGDGIPDGQDANPRVALQATERDPRAQLIAEALRATLPAHQLVLVESEFPVDLRASKLELLTLTPAQVSRYDRLFGMTKAIRVRLGKCPWPKLNPGATCRVELSGGNVEVRVAAKRTRTGWRLTDVEGTFSAAVF